MVRTGAVLLTLVTLLSVSASSAAEEPSPWWLTTPCEHEDSANCYWDADAAGNGEGHSFFAVRVRGEVCVLYAERRYARRHNHCVPSGRS